MLDRAVAPRVPVQDALLERARAVQREGKHRERAGQARDVHDGDGGRGRGVVEGGLGRVVRVVVGEDAGVGLLEEGEGAQLDVGALVLVREVDRGVQFCEVVRGRPGLGVDARSM